RGMIEAVSKAALIGAQVAPMRGMIEAVSKAALLDAQVAPMRGIIEAVSKAALLDAQVAPMRGMIEAVSKAALLDAQVAPIRGMAETLFMAASSPSLGIDSTLKAALSPSFGMMNQALFDGFADMVDKGALGSISGLGTIDVDQIVENFSARVRPRNSDVSLERER